jgi:hypothetical protein
MAMLLFVLSACGAGGNSAGSSAPTATVAPTASAGNGTAQGCPSNAVVNNLPKANEIVIPSGVSTTVFAHPGDVIELHMPFGKMWSGPTNTSTVVELQQPAGYALSASKACVWRFTAKSVGTARLNFTMRPICKKGSMCPMYIAQLPVTIAVK